jgi:DNA-binding transcriptional ArsR family regulator
MKKNIQSIELVLPNLIFEEKNKVNNFHNIFDLLKVNDKLSRNQTFTFNFNESNTEEDNHQQPLQPLKYQYNDSKINDESHVFIDNLRNNDKKILALLSEEDWSTYSFKALERKLGIHQQSLSRALKRLEYLNLVEKTPYGYKIKGKNIIPLISIIQNNQLEEQEEPLPFGTITTRKTKKRYNQLIQIRIPIKSNIDIIVKRLVGKWFGNLRWFGLIKKEAGFTLQWVAINKYNSSSSNNNNNLFQINLNIVSEYIVIETNATSDKEKIDAMSYSNRLVEEITKILQSNIKEKEYEIPEEIPIARNFSSTYTNKLKYKSNKINKQNDIKH